MHFEFIETNKSEICEKILRSLPDWFGIEYLGCKGYRYLTVKTLSESRSNEEYDRTRNFYYGVWFLPVEEFKTLWGEHNPCLLLIKNILSLKECHMS